MAKTKDKQKLLMRQYDLTGSMKQSVNPYLMGDSEFLYLKNVAYDEVGSISKDGGYTQAGSDLNASGGINLLHDYLDYSNNHTLLAIANGDLMKASSSYVYTSIDSTTFTADVESDAINYKGLAYITNGTDGLFYANAGLTSVTSVDADNGAASVKGKYLATLDDVLYLANITTVHSENDVVFTTAGSNTFYVPSLEGYSTYATTSNRFSADGAITGIKAFQGTIVYFTEEQMYLFNPLNANVTVVCNIGCTSHKSIQEINGVLYWANRDGIYRFDGGNLPEMISLPILNWTINSLWRMINGSNWGILSALAFEGKYMLSVGNLTAKLPGDASTLSNVIIVFDTYRNTWYFLDNHPATTMIKFINSSGNQRILFGSSATPSIFQKDYSYGHDGSAIEMIIRSKYFTFDNPEKEKVLQDMFVSYRPSAQTAKYIDVSTAINGSNSYTAKVGSTTSTKLELDGAATTDFQMERVTIGGLRARSVSYEFKNDDLAVNMVLLGYSQEFTYLESNMNYSV